MKKKEMSYVDVRRGKETKGTRSANLMCYLLKGITYNQLYVEVFSKDTENGDTLTTLEALRTNAQGLPGDLCVDDEGSACNINNALSNPDPNAPGALDKIKTLLLAYPDDQPKIFLRDLFLNKPVAGSNPRTYAGMCNEIVDILDDVRDSGGVKYSHFCVPFVAVQKGKEDPVLGFEFADFLHYFGEKEIKYFYEHWGNSKERKAIVRAKEAGILSEIRPAPIQVEVHSGNGMICSNGVCISSSNPNHFCSMIEEPGTGNMHCSLYSDQA